MVALADIAPYGADLTGPAFLPRLRRGLHEFARFAGFYTTDGLKLAVMGRLPTTQRTGSRFIGAGRPRYEENPSLCFAILTNRSGKS